jgi:site-specific DNA-methyltransferase (adenine-specific)
VSLDATSQFRTPLGELFCGDSLRWLATLDDASVDLVVADPPYGVGKAEWDNFDSRQDYVRWSRIWLEQVARILRPEGSAYVMGYSEVLADLKWAAGDLFVGCRWLVWSYRNRGNLGSDWGRSHESLLHLRKGRSFTMNLDAVRVPYNAHTSRYPKRKQGGSSQYSGKAGATSWTPHPLGAKPRDVLEIPLLNNGMAEKTSHPTQKPEELLRRIIAASSNDGDLVVDPFSGSGTTAVVCELLGRSWMVCEQSQEYCELAATRLGEVLAGRHSLADLKKAERKMANNRDKVRGVSN